VILSGVCAAKNLLPRSPHAKGKVPRLATAGPNLTTIPARRRYTLVLQRFTLALGVYARPAMVYARPDGSLRPDRPACQPLGSADCLANCAAPGAGSDRLALQRRRDFIRTRSGCRRCVWSG